MSKVQVLYYLTVPKKFPILAGNYIPLRIPSGKKEKKCNFLIIEGGFTQRHDDTM